MLLECFMLSFINFCLIVDNCFTKSKKSIDQLMCELIMLKANYDQRRT